MKLAMTSALREAKSLSLGLHSLLERRLALSLPAIAEACSTICMSSPNEELMHQACSILNNRLHMLPTVRKLGAVQGVDNLTSALPCIALCMLRTWQPAQWPHTSCCCSNIGASMYQLTAGHLDGWCSLTVFRTELRHILQHTSDMFTVCWWCCRSFYTALKKPAAVSCGRWHLTKLCTHAGLGLWSCSRRSELPLICITENGFFYCPLRARLA